MRRTKRQLSTIAAVLTLALLVSSLSIIVAADTASVPSLTISQFKITSSSGQFITLYNTTNSALDMSKYQLEYFNSYDLAKATSSKLIALSGTVPPHGYFMVSDASTMLCFQMVVDSVSLGLSSTAGYIEVLAMNQSTPGSSAAPGLQDYVGWSKTAAAGAQTLPTNANAFLQRQPNTGVTSPGAGSWQIVQPESANACNLVTPTGVLASITPGLLLPSDPPTATIVTISDDDSVAPSPSIPDSDIGLMKPQITELLPNPDGTGNDSTDEYIELYNPNDSNFDLTGFSLQSGLTRFRKYTFPAGTTLAPHSFTAYYSDITDLSLSNTSGQVKLLDSLGSSISETEVYKNAKDGQSWSLAKGHWFWTTSPTPNLANVINQPSAKKKTSTKSSSSIKVKSGPNANKAKLSSTAASFDQPVQKSPVHTGVLALIVIGAILYGAYEYRADVANAIYQLRRNIGARRPHRQ